MESANLASRRLDRDSQDDHHASSLSDRLILGRQVAAVIRPR
jgi:hypothetical protein